MDANLRALAEEGKWNELGQILLKAKPPEGVRELAPLLEAWGDASVATGWTAKALDQYRAAMQAYWLLIYDVSMATEQAGFVLAYNRITEKYPATQKLLEKEMRADQKGKLEWVSATKRVLQLGLQGRANEAGHILQRLARWTKKVGTEAILQFGEQLEQAADTLPLPDKELEIWFYESCREQLRLAKQASDGEAYRRVEGKIASVRPPPAPVRSQPKPKPRPHVPPPEASQALVEELAKFARELEEREWEDRLRDPALKPLLPSLARRFEAMGDDAEFKNELSLALQYYGVASGAMELYNADRRGIVHKARSLSPAILQARMENPLPADTPPPEFKNWYQGVDWVVRIALAGRLREASRVLSDLKRSRAGERGNYGPGPFQLAGDYVSEKHPKMARWFYQQVRDWVSGLPVDNAATAHIANCALADAERQLEEVEARLLQSLRTATIRVELSVQQYPRLRGGPKPVVTSHTLRHGEILTLSFDRNPPLPEKDPEVYALRARLAKEEVYLDQVPDERDRTLPCRIYELSRLQKGGASGRLTTYYTEPGGPEWTLNITRIVEGHLPARAQDDE